MGANLGRRELRRCDRGGCGSEIARGEVYQANLVQHLGAPFAGEAKALAASLSHRCARSSPAAALRTRLDDRLRVPGALSLPRRGSRLSTMPIKGTQSGRCRRRGREGCRGARDDRRPRAQRSLTGLPARLGRVARADGAARARGRHPSRLEGRRAPFERTPHLAEILGARLFPWRLHHRRLRRSPPFDLIAALEPVGAGGLDGSPRRSAPGRRLRARAHDPDVRRRRRSRAPLGGRRNRVGTGSRRRRSRSRGSRRGPC